MQTTQLGAAVAAARPMIPAESRRPGIEFERIFLTLLNEESWSGRARDGGQVTKDCLRRPTLRTVGEVLAHIAANPQKRGRVNVIIEQLHGWALAHTPDGDGCLLHASETDAREDGESDAALMPVLSARRDRVALERAARERAEQIVASQRVLRLLHLELAKVA